MSAGIYTEDALVQKTTADYLEQHLGWQSVYAYNAENFGPDGLLGRNSDREMVLTRPLRSKLVDLNPGLPDAAYDEAVRQIAATSAAQTLPATNREKYALIRDGVPIAFRNHKDERVRQRLRVFDFAEPAKNDFLCVRELWIRGDIYHKRADIVGFVNGLPLLFMELKNVNKNIRAAYDGNFKDYKDTVPHLFHHNAFVILANGIDAKIGSVTSRFEHFHDWKRLAEDAPGVVDMETLLKGVCDKTQFMDLLENFILFDDSAGEPKKILARNHQFLGVNRAVDAVRDRDRRDGKLGVFWHTQGAGKSYSMVLFTRKVHRKLGGNFTFLVLTDRDDLDTQIYKTFAGCGVADNDRDPCRASSGDHLKRLLGRRKSHIFSLIQKFHRDVTPDDPYTHRDDVIVITDEAHRTQYGTLALNMRNALPNAAYDISRIDFDRLRKEFERSPRKRTTVQNLKQAIEDRLQRLLRQNPLRTDFQRHYEEIVADYNREKDRVAIEQTFEDLLRFVDEMNDEESRAVREGLDEESLAVFDLLKKPDLSAKEIERIKSVAVALLQTLKAEKLRIQHWRDKEATRDAVRLAIRDFLWDDATGLPVNRYNEDDVKARAEDVYAHVFHVYPSVPSPYYQAQATA